MTPEDKAKLRADLILKARIEGRRSLMTFSRLMWPVIEPKTPFKDNWHLHAIAEHLEATKSGELRNLLINIPPRHMKSILISVMFPAWSWLDWPESRWLFSSYAETLSKRDSVKCRRVIESPLYAEIFEPDWKLAGDQNEKLKFENDRAGHRIATSVGGQGTGEGGDFVVVDDPHKATDVHSDTKREGVIEWWREEMSSRLNDPKTGRKIIVMQRLHEKDLTGELLKDGGWTHLKIPARYYPKTTVVTPWFKDPRTEEGQLLWPERVGEAELAALSKELGSLASSAQLDQDPRPASGGLFKRVWWQYYSERPAVGQILRICQFWDTAQEPGVSNDYSVCATWAETATGYYLLDLWREKVEAPDLERAALALAEKWKPSAILIENKSSGVSLRQTLQRETKLPILKFEPGQNSKLVRATAATPTVEAGNCFLPKGAPWVEDFVKEHEKMPLVEHDDQVDTTSMMVEYFKNSKPPQPRVRTL